MMLSLSLFLVLVASGVLTWLVFQNEELLLTNPTRASKFFTRYVWFIFLALAGAGIGWHIGWIKPYGSPAIDDLKERRLEHYGYYVEPEAAFRFAQTTSDEGFQHDALEPDEFLQLKALIAGPDERSGPAAIDNWEITFRATSLPLRFDGLCVNLPAGAWLRSGDVLTVVDTQQEPSPYIALRWTEEKTWKRENAYYFSAGYRFSDGRDSTLYTDVLLTDRIYRESRQFNTMLRRAPAAFRAQVRVEPAWLEMAQGITWVRKRIGAIDSPMGVLINRRFYEEDEGRPRGYRAELNGQILTQERTGATTDTTVAPGASIRYGFTGYRNLLAFEALSDTLLQDARNGYLVPLSFKRKPSWPLPYEAIVGDGPTSGSFIITSSDAYTELPSYVINTVGQSYPFYLKVTMQNPNSLRLNDGRRDTRVGLDQVTSLGADAHGALLALRPVRVPALMALVQRVPVGLWATLFFLLNTLGFHLLMRSEPRGRLKLDLAFSLIWAMTAALLIVRLVLAYRVALLMPENATAGEITFVFRKSFVVSFWALVLLPLVLLVARASYHSRWQLAARLAGRTQGVRSMIARHVKKPSVSLPPRLSKMRPLLTALARHWMLWVLPWGWILLGKMLGTNESLFGIRISIGLHILLIIGLFFSFSKIIRDARPYEDWLAIGLTVLAVGGCMVIIKDYGFFIYGFSFLACFAILALRNYTRTGRNAYGRFVLTRTTAVIAAIILIPLGTSLIPRVPAIAALVGNIDPQGNVFYRLTSYTDTEEAVLLGTGDEQDYSTVQLLRNSYQNWQMTLYAAEGAHNDRGYGGAVLSDAGMTYPTSVTDCAYSMYLLSEHGKIAGLLLLLLYVVLCFGCAYGGWLLARQYLARTLTLFLIGAYFACNALYMAAANLGLVFFTGQNIPLLGLYSGADVLQAMFLLGLAVVLLYKGVREEGGGSAWMNMAQHPGMFKAQKWFLGTLAALCVLLLIRHSTLPERYMKDHNFSPNLFRVISERDWTYDPDTGTISVASGSENLGLLRRIEELYRDQFNERPNKTDEKGGLYYIVPIEEQRRGTRYEVRVNRFLFILVSPFKEQSTWRGTVLARSDEALPTLSTLGIEFRLRLDSTRAPATIVFAQNPSADEVVGSALKLVDARTRNSIFELEREGNDLILEGTGRAVYFNGRELEHRVRLKENDLIAVEDDAGTQQTFLYLGMQAPILGASQWRNGDWQHVYPGAYLFPAIYTMMQAGRDAYLLAAGEAPAALADTLNLSLDIPLFQDLQDVLERHALASPRYHNNDLLGGNRLAFTVLDAHSGEVLALPAWPRPDPNAPEFDELLRTASPRQELRLLQNHNYRRHVIGSTTKPVLFTSLAATLWNPSADSTNAAAQIDLATMAVHARGQPGRVYEGKVMQLAHDSLGGLPLGTPWDSDRRIQGEVIDVRAFIYRSLNYYMGVAGMIGTLLDPSHLAEVLVPVQAGSPYRDVLLDGVWYRLDMARMEKAAPGQTVFTLEDLQERRPPRILTTRIRRSLLWRGLRENYDVLVGGLDVMGSPTALNDSALVRSVQRFLPSFDQGRTSLQNGYLNEAMPDPMVLDPRQWEGYLRQDLISFFLGGGLNLWSNVGMAEAGARLATGRRVEARLEHRSDTLVFDDMPLPLGDPSWRNANIIIPMEDAGTEANGTARAIYNGLNRNSKQLVSTRYRLLFKTGTLQERRPEDPRSELLLCIVGEWDALAERFVSGRTLSSFLYMQESKTGPGYARNQLAPRLIEKMLLHLERTREKAPSRVMGAAGGQRTI